MSDERVEHGFAGDEVSWHYDIPILTNPFMLWDMLRVLVISVAIMWVLVAFTGWIIDGEPVLLPAFVLGITFGVVAALFVIAGVLLGNRQGARFVVSREGIGYAAEARERKLNRIVTIVGVLAASPQTAGAGLLAQSQEDMFVPWTEIHEVRFYPRSSVISIRNSWRTVLRLHCTSELYDHVVAAVQLYRQGAELAQGGSVDEPRVPRLANAWRVGAILACAVGAQSWYWVDDEMSGRVAIVAAVILMGAVLLAGPGRRILGFLALLGFAYRAYAMGMSAVDPIQGMSGTSYGYGYQLDTPLLLLSALCAIVLLIVALWCVFGRTPVDAAAPEADGNLSS